MQIEKTLRTRLGAKCAVLGPICTVCALLVTIGCQSVRQPTTRTFIESSDTQRILFLGDSITYDGRYVAGFETWLLTRYPKRDFEVINVGLPSETVSGLTEEGHADGAFDRPFLMDRLPSILDKTRPDLVFVCYGMNCGIYMPLDDGRFRRYRDGITKLHDAAIAAGAHIVHITPPMYDAKHAAGHVAEYDGVLAAYGDWLLSKRADGWHVIDLHGPMAAETQRRRARDPAFTFAPDGVHPDDAGHWLMAQQIIACCGDRKAASRGSAQELLGDDASILPLVSERMAIMRNAWLTYTGHTHPHVPPGLPLEVARAKREELTTQIKSALGK